MVRLQTLLGPAMGVGDRRLSDPEMLRNLAQAKSAFLPWQVLRLPDDKAPESSLEQVSASPVPTVVPWAIRHLQLLHRRREVRFMGLNQQMVVVAHEHIGEDTQPESLRASAEPVEKALVVILIPEDGPPLIAAIEHVAERALLIYA